MEKFGVCDASIVADRQPIIITTVLSADVCSVVGEEFIYSKAERV